MNSMKTKYVILVSFSQIWISLCILFSDTTKHETCFHYTTTVIFFFRKKNGWWEKPQVDRQKDERKNAMWYPSIKAAGKASEN